MTNFEERIEEQLKEIGVASGWCPERGQGPEGRGRKEANFWSSGEDNNCLAWVQARKVSNEHREANRTGGRRHTRESEEPRGTQETT